MRFRPDIEGLRAIAIVAVVGFHIHAPGFSGGYVGVDIFFVLSGYLITGLIVAEIAKTGRFSLSAFYARRFRRLLPAAMTMLLGSFLLARLLYAPLEMQGLGETARSVSLYASNFRFIGQTTQYLAADPATNPLLHTWSLAVEEQFYLVWPLLLLAVAAFARGRFRVRRAIFWVMAIVAFASFIACVKLTASNQPWAFYGPLTRFWEFAIGAIAVVAVRRRALAGEDAAPISPRLATRIRRRGALAGALALLGFAAIALSLHRFNITTPFPGKAAALPTLATVAVLVAGEIAPSARPIALLGSAPMRLLGRHSYGWYLWHWPLLIYTRVLWPDPAPLLRLGVVLLALGIAIISYRYIERPIRYHRALVGHHRRSVLAGLALGGLGVLGAAAMVGYGESRAASPGQAELAAARQDLPDIYRRGCALAFAAVETPPGCHYGNPDSARLVYLVGDSHAAQIFPALQILANKHDWRLEARTKASCSSTMAGFIQGRLGRAYSECFEWRDNVFGEILQRRPDLVVLAGSHGEIEGSEGAGDFGLSLSEFEQGTRRTAELLDQAGIDHVLLQDLPRPLIDVPVCMARQLSAPIHADCSFTREESSRADARRAVKRAYSGELAAGEHLIDLAHLVCPSDPCPLRLDDLIVYRDPYHLTASFAATLADPLADALFARPSSRALR